jgi:SAM-dependent methyltransferase
LLQTSRLGDIIIREPHRRLATARRSRVLLRHLHELIPPDAQILDVGCGDGLIGEMVMAARPDSSIQGIDIFLRPPLRMPVLKYDGVRIPHSDQSFDVVLLLDVLHHTTDPMPLLREARRVSRKYIIIKDHNRDGFAARPLLRFMDWVANAPHGVVLPYNYWSSEQWRAAFGVLGLKMSEYRSQLGLYPFPGNWVFERSLHFIARLEVGHGDRQRAI